MGFKGKDQTRSLDAGSQLTDMILGAESSLSCGFLFALTPVSMLVTAPAASNYAPKLSGASVWI